MGDPMIEYRKVTDKAEISRAVRLILRVFTECVAPMFVREGLECFRAYIYSGAIEDSMETCRGAMICAYDGEIMAGVICTLDRRHISNLYVDSAYHRKGIATELLLRRYFCAIEWAPFIHFLFSILSLKNICEGDEKVKAKKKVLSFLISLILAVSPAVSCMADLSTELDVVGQNIDSQETEKPKEVDIFLFQRMIVYSIFFHISQEQ